MDFFLLNFFWVNLLCAMGNAVIDGMQAGVGVLTLEGYLNT